MKSQNRVKQLLLSTLLTVVAAGTFRVAEADQLLRPVFPITPQTQTPGALCEQADSYRYPEHIKYCERAVSVAQKWTIIRDYETMGYAIEEFRNEFKIDHLIPLCAGGANSPDNLWPQHQSVYALTDKIEPLLCDVMAAGRITQADAVILIRNVKMNPETADEVFSDLEHKLRSALRDMWAI